MARVEDHDTFVWIKRTISQAEYESVKRLAVPGISFREENKRFYPLGPLAALSDISKLPRLTERLVQRGFADVDIHKVLGGNLMRVYRQVWGE